MNPKDHWRDSALVAAGHEVRLRALEQSANDEEGERLRAEADRLLGGADGAFEGDTDQLRRDADRLLGRAPTAFEGRPAAVRNLDWNAIVEVNRDALLAEGLDPATLSLDAVVAPETLAQIDAEWTTFSVGLDARLDAEAIAALTASCRRAVVDAIVRPLGLGRLVARFDHVGGGVLTPHNAEAADTGAVAGADCANQERLADYVGRRSESYSHRDYEDGFPAARKERFKDPTPLRDGYAPDRELRRDGTTHLDHVISAKRIHEDRDANFFLTAEQRRSVANSPENLTFTNSSLNQSKGDRKPSEWMDRERPDGTTNAEKYGVDREEALRRERAAEAHVQDSLRSPRMKYYLKETALAGAGDAVKMGLQQAVGAVLVEVVIGLFEEVTDLARTGRQGRPLLDDFAARARRVAERVSAAWCDVVDAFKQGALAGLLSTVVTAVINSVLTTGKRVVRVIREGVLSLLKAVRLLVAPPRGMDAPQAGHEASKLIAAALSVSAGILAEEVVEKSICAAVPVLSPVAPVLSVALTGLATGLSSVLLVTLLDRLDLFGAVARERGERRLMAMRERTDRLLDELLTAQGA